MSLNDFLIKVFIIHLHDTDELRVLGVECFILRKGSLRIYINQYEINQKDDSELCTTKYLIEGTKLILM